MRARVPENSLEAKRSHRLVSASSKSGDLAHGPWWLLRNNPPGAWDDPNHRRLDHQEASLRVYRSFCSPLGILGDKSPQKLKYVPERFQDTPDLINCDTPDAGPVEN
ncbi:hypothetical protein MW887_007410 [Aspergillus wentii]|nr:hypothetical protein MW887_007410 [Aspergillus wentii]